MRIEGHGNQTVKVRRNHYEVKCSCGWAEAYAWTAKDALIDYRTHLLKIRNLEMERLNDANIQG